MKKIGQILSWIVTLAIFGFAGVLILSRFNTPLGVRIFTVISGSMEPAIPTGSVVLVKSADSYQIGDIVTVRSESSAKNTVTHRIHGIEEKELSDRLKYQLKGDANEEPDPETVNETRVIGKVITHVPYLGRAVAFSQSQLGFMILIVMPATLIIYNEVMTLKKEIPELISKHRSKKSDSDHKVAEA